MSTQSSVASKASDKLAELLKIQLGWMDSLDLLLGPLVSQPEWISVRSKIISAESEIEQIIERWKREGD